ncbi:outer membrane lipoprotein LolB [Massilia litorea]|jgi:outer membrane lipoprotein LolB|uniref:Outer-membrane lipoprotein LolB n=1 Tax=Massilia litorea TaxID=2769491 RepID=A0A7L9U8J4_9BURK|nr:outer membrane lipoprotein LolB [Massilia litorea]QOL50416.1 outer membrane lipoprotein LolB [Massilia litorea]
MPINRRLSLFVLAAALAGCATTATQPSGTATAAAVAPYRDTIELTGRLQVTYQKDGQPGSTNGGFEWSQRPGQIDVAFLSPLKQTVATISVTPQGATLTEAGRAPRTASDIDTLSAQALGWALPVSGLRDWLQGYATGADGKRFIASPANNSVYTRDGWRLRFVSWQAGKDGAQMPRNIVAERGANAGSELAIQIILDPSA